MSITTLPADFKGISNCAEILVHPNGKFLYASNRGHDSLAVFAIETATGRLTPVEYAPTQGKMPRNFAFDPTGRWILVTNHGKCSAAIVHSLKGGQFAVQPRFGTHRDRKLYKTPKSAATAATRLVKQCRIDLKRRR